MENYILSTPQILYYLVPFELYPVKWSMFCVEVSFQLDILFLLYW
jgi:hypothetical protein